MVYSRIRSGIRVFLEFESSSGIVLMLSAVLAIVFANSSHLVEWYGHFLHTEIGVVAGEAGMVKSVSHWINDGLMAIFFLLVGLEIKRELVQGELSMLSQATLPMVAAIGGMVAPALIYASFNWGDSQAMRGWAIPVATDIAFSLGVLSLLGSRVPIGLKVFLTAVAVIDDLLAILIIALFYTSDLDFTALAYSGVTIAVLFLLNRCRVDSIPIYVLVGAVLWFFVLKSGVHATLAGVATAMAVPVDGRSGHSSPLKTMEHHLHVPVAFLILPMFAFANAGINFQGLSFSSLLEAIPCAIALGLLFGKVVGIFSATFVFVKLGFAKIPSGCSWPMILALSLLCGIGFTVSLFIGTLAFGEGMEEQLNLVRLGVLVGSAVAGLLGYVALMVALPPRKAGAGAAAIV